ncbi:polysaccharide deacetylase family protein [Allopusillimonas ginsengisoli]|uniref:polysaccharide deacetylase family protein n=1 Tax=Allopusillimonas ginsengisoli TaxID=453575 RepID=UPI00101EFF4F|nr:polysaccharide deacetylase family protein [Allopusillimonas ginsengisoli]TEA78814.1 polysaccharide deacetylase [Allopusillimonas ginsengisoli]
MTLTDEYLSYPARRYGMDHSLYPWSDLLERSVVKWPNDARVALWVTPILQWFPLNAPAKPFRPTGGLTMPYPDFRHYSGRDYGNRVGIFRILEVLKELNIPASVALNSAIARRYPALMEHLQSHNVAYIAHGVDMGHLHYTGLSAADESAQIVESLQTLREATGQPVKGWLSPGRSQSFNTPSLLARHGIEYCCDWVNDDMPYAMQTDEGVLYSMPLEHESSDLSLTFDFFQDEEEWLRQTKARFDVLYRESLQYGGRVVSVPLHAWISGVPYRIGKVREALSYMLAHEGVWAATAGEILTAFRPAGELPDA